MKKELENRVYSFANSTEFPEAVYFSQKVPDARFKREKYFFLYHNTNVVAWAFISEKKLDEFLKSKGF